MDKYNKTLLLAGLGISVAGGFAYLLSSLFSSKETLKEKITKDVALKMIKEYKRASLRVFVKSAEIVQRLQLQYGGQYEMQSGQTIGDLISKDVLKELENERLYVANKYNITLQSFEDSYESDFQDDTEIQNICKWIVEQYENSLKGISPPLDVKQEVMNKFPEDKVIEMQKKILKTQSKSFNRVFKEVKEETQNEQVDPQSELFKRKIRELDVHQIKTSLLKEEGFEFEPESPCETFEKLSFKYKKTSTSYQQKLSQVIAIYDKIKSDIIYSKVDDSYIELIFK